MLSDEKKGKLSRLEKKLYSRKAPEIIDSGRSEFDSPKSEKNEEKVKENWNKTDEDNFDELAQRVSKMAQSKHNFAKKIFIFSAIFFVVAIGVAALVFLGGMNTISSKNVDIKVVGPLSVGGGQEVSFDLNIINNNNVDLNSASLLVEYPEGTRSAQNLSEELNQERFSLETIKSGESFSQNIKAVFFGEKESLKQLKLSLEYRVENSSALFYKEKVYEISISSAPVIITPTYPKEVNSNQEITLDLELVSNSKDEIKNFLVNVDYPFGFVFEEAFPSPTFDENVWEFSNLGSGEKRKISIEGTIIGQDNEERVFKINAGSASEQDERIIAVPFSQLTESIFVKKSFIGLDVLIGGGSGDFVGQGGSQVTTRFTVRNNLSSKLFNTSVEVALSGGALNQSKIFPSEGGFYQSFNNTILWDKRSVMGLSEMEPGSTETLSFRLSPLVYSEVARGAKPEINMVIKVMGERILDSGSVENISFEEDKKITLATDLTLSSRTVRSLGNIENSGPIPPKADIPTTYTIIWGISNSFHQVSNVEIRATLPSYVEWTGFKSPQDEDFSFNPVTNEVVWDVGSVLPHTGFDSPKKEMYFQLEFLPSVGQVGLSPALLGETSISAIDKITGKKIEYSVAAVTTAFSSDPTFKVGDDKVVE